MAKKKSNKKKNSTRDQAENIQEQGNEGANVENMNEENKNMQNTHRVIVLGIFMHCQGCADTITKHLRGYDGRVFGQIHGSSYRIHIYIPNGARLSGRSQPSLTSGQGSIPLQDKYHDLSGVEQIEIDLKNHKVTVKGKTVDPERIAEWLRKRSNKHISLISPTLKEEKKEEVVEVVLKIYMHCESCAADIKYNIHKMQGVLTVETDMKNSQVIVKGAFDPKKLVDFISRRVGKNAVVVKQTQPEKKEEDKGKKGKKNEMEMDHIYPPGHVYAPDRILSEENPNACSMM